MISNTFHIDNTNTQQDWALSNADKAKTQPRRAHILRQKTTKRCHSK